MIKNVNIKLKSHVTIAQQLPVVNANRMKFQCMNSREVQVQLSSIRDARKYTSWSNKKAKLIVNGEN